MFKEVNNRFILVGLKISRIIKENWTVNLVNKNFKFFSEKNIFKKTKPTQPSIEDNSLCVIIKIYIKILKILKYFLIN